MASFIYRLSERNNEEYVEALRRKLSSFCGYNFSITSLKFNLVNDGSVEFIITVTNYEYLDLKITIDDHNAETIYSPDFESLPPEIYQAIKDYIDRRRSTISNFLLDVKNKFY